MRIVRSSSLIATCIGKVGTKISPVVSNANLARIAKDTGLLKHIQVLDPSISAITSVHRLGTIMEALVGAIHEDSGKDAEAVRGAMNRMGLTLPPNLYTAKARRILQKPNFAEARTKDLGRLDGKSGRSQGLQGPADQLISEHADMDQEDLGHRIRGGED